MTTLAQVTELGPVERHSIRENGVLDEYEIPFGEWAEQMVNWLDTHLTGDGAWLPVLDWIAAPVSALLDIAVDDVFTNVSWVWTCLAVGLVGWLTRGPRVAVSSMVGLVVCGLLGSGFWIETAHTLGVISVVMFLCSIIGIPLGVAAARSDGLWRVLRVVLDAMQVVHPFAYLLPFLFFFGLGDTGSALATMIYAIPPLVRLTHLGVRQLPVDVVEAARSFGAGPVQMTRDVYIPLSRATIVAGLNQTLILALSMHAIAGLLGGGGLGRLLFRGLSSVGMPQVIASGTAFVIVSLVLDALTRPAGAGDGTLTRRVLDAWSAVTSRRLPAVRRVSDAGADGSVATPLASWEHRLAQLAVGAAVLGAVGVVSLDWSTGGSRVSGHVRAADLDLPGRSFDGLAASGGSWFGVVSLAAVVFVAWAALATVMRTSSRNRWLGPDGVLIGAVMACSGAVAFMATRPADGTAGHSLGAGPFVVLLAGATALGVGVAWLLTAPYAAVGSRRAVARSWRANIAAVGLALLALGAGSGWTFDTRAEPVITPEVQAELDRLLDLARDPATAARAASDFRALMAAVQFSEPIAHNGLTSSGAGLGVLTLVLGVGVTASLWRGSTALVSTEARRHLWSAVSLALALSITAIAVAWIASLARVSDPKVVSGVGAAFTLVAGLILASASWSAVASRTRVRVDPESFRFGDDVPDTV